MCLERSPGELAFRGPPGGQEVMPWRRCKAIAELALNKGQDREAGGCPRNFDVSPLPGRREARRLSGCLLRPGDAFPNCREARGVWPLPDVPCVVREGPTAGPPVGSTARPRR